MIRDFRSGSIVQDCLVTVLSMSEKPTKTGKTFWVLTICDSSGEAEAKVWSDYFNKCQIEAGKVIRMNAKIGEWNGKIDVNILQAQIVDDESPDDYRYRKPTLVFDIETAGVPFERLGEFEQDYLLHNLQKDLPEDEAKEKTALFSLYGQVVAIAGMDPFTQKGVILTISDKPLTCENKNFMVCTYPNETQLLQGFWELTPDYEQFVTYNGREFDWPYLLIRSGINRVKVPLVIDHHNSNKFIDLQDKLKQGRAFKLQAICRAFGISDPKEKGVSGLHVSRLFTEGQIQEIVDYVSRDVLATGELYKLWYQYLSGLNN